MKQKLILAAALGLLIVLLIGLNAASYRPKEKTADTELTANRSTFNYGSTGTAALFALIAETGGEPVRWQTPPASLLREKGSAPDTFVIIAPGKREIASSEADDLFNWVAAGRTLVLVDRDLPEKLALKTARWTITTEGVLDPRIFDADPADPAKMTNDTAAARPVQPTVFAQGVEGIMPSIFASSIRISPNTEAGDETKGNRPPVAAITDASTAGPVVQFASDEKAVVVEMPYGEGTIYVISDPYIFSNGGIGLADNAKFALALLGGKGRRVAFDEFHQGYGEENNKFLQFFAGTPVVPIFVQLCILAGAVFYSQSRRFARAVPEPEPDRLSKLEYISAMAELQSRTKAYDLAIENIYSDLRRRIARNFGLDNFTATTDDVASLIAERTGGNASDIRETLAKCEEIIRGEPTSSKETLHLAEALRTIEKQLGMDRGRRQSVR